MFKFKKIFLINSGITFFILNIFILNSSCSKIYSGKYQRLRFDTDYDGKVRAIIKSSVGETKFDFQ